MDRRRTKMMAAAVIVVVLALLLSACEPAVPEDPTDAPPEVEQAAMMELSDQTGIAMEDMEVVRAVSREWPDACLGLPEPEEQCAEVLTAGWQVTVAAEGEEYVLRTDDLGTVVRME